MTLEKIKGMNLQVGTPIEVTEINGSKEVSYFKFIKNESLIVSTTLSKDKTSEKRGLYSISQIEDIKILEYQK